jgi:hypothetical protein
MKRITLPALLVFIVFFSPANERSSAQQAAQKEPPATKWMKLGEGVQVLRLWKSVGPKWPQIAILRLSVEEYKDFLEHPVDYLNVHKVYPPEYLARKFVPCRLAQPPKEVLGKQSGECMVMLRHDITSTSVGTSSCSVQF